MSRILYFIIAALTASLLVVGGCGMNDQMKQINQNTDRMAKELENDREYIKVLSESLAALHKLGSAMFESVMAAMFTTKAPAQTPDIDDVLKGSNPPKPVPPQIKEESQ